jgi:hypothetical protein
MPASRNRILIRSLDSGMRQRRQWRRLLILSDWAETTPAGCAVLVQGTHSNTLADREIIARPAEVGGGNAQEQDQRRAIDTVLE